MLISTYAGAFNGIGGLDLAAELVTGARPLFHAEPDPYCAAVLARHWPGVHNYGAIQNIDSKAKTPDIFVAGVPCTDASSAGKRKGLRAKEDVPARQPDASGPGAHVADGVHDGREGLSSRHDDDRHHAPGHEPDGRHPLVWPGWPPALGDEEGWSRYDGARPGVRRSAYGLPRGLDARRRRARLARLGNAVVWQQAALALAELMIRAAQPG